jgi:hypothetical protein
MKIFANQASQFENKEIFRKLSRKSEIKVVEFRQATRRKEFRKSGLRQTVFVGILEQNENQKYSFDDRKISNLKVFFVDFKINFQL